MAKTKKKSAAPASPAEPKANAPETKDSPARQPSTPASPAVKANRRILSGVQPSGKLHLGNYFGAIKQHIALQDEPNSECFYFIANYHALTTVRDREELHRLSHDVALDYLALGLDPARTVFYRQSDVPQVCELTWLLATVTGMGLLERAHSYKDKVARGIAPDVGLFIYPILMASDILAPQSDLVPVGADQKQHIEMTRDMAGYFNNTYKRDVFKIPDYRESPTPRVPGTTYDKYVFVGARVDIERRDHKGAAALMEEASAAIGKHIEAHKESLPRLESEFFADLKPALQAALGEEPYRRVRVQLTNQEPAGKYLKDAAGDRVAAIAAVSLPSPVFHDEDKRRQPAKMSKSYGNTIDIFAEGNELKKQVMGIETDIRALEDPLDPDDCLVFALYRLFATADEQAEMAEAYRKGGFGYGNAKKRLLEKVDATFGPAREKRKQLIADPDFVEDVLREGARKAGDIATATLNAARDACGL